MAFLRRFRTFMQADGELRMLFFRALFLSAFVRFAIVCLPFRKVLSWKGTVNVESPSVPHPDSLPFRRSVQQAIRLSARYAPWRMECYTRALTGRILLRRKGLPGTIYVGFRKLEDGRYAGHAWLRSYDGYITGGEEKDRYTVHTCYS
jgi:hypothetical protein